MALAVLTHVGSTRGTEDFDVRIGQNRYFKLVVGHDTLRGEGGFDRIAEVAHETLLEGPLPDSRLGRARVRLPSDLFDRDVRLVQLVSTRDAEGNGPAVSDIVEVRPRHATRHRPPVPAGAPPRPAALSLEPGGPRMTALSRSAPSSAPSSPSPGFAAMQCTPMGQGPHRVVLREARMSEAAGIGAIGSLITSALPGVISSLAPAVESLAPAIGQMISGMVKGGMSGGGSGVTAGAQPAGAAAARMACDAETQRLLAQLLQQVVAATAATRGAGAGGQQATQQSLVSRARSIGPQTARRRHPSAAAPPTAEAFAVPAALLAALPALMPLLKNVLNPQTIQSVVDAPNKHMGTIINGVTDLFKLGIKSQEGIDRHLRELTPSIDDPALDALLQSMSLSVAQAVKEEPAYKRAASVRLTLDTAPPVDVQGVETAAYMLGRDWGVALSVDTPRTIPDGRVHVFVKDAETLEILLKAKGAKGDIAAGPLPHPMGIPAEATDHLEPGRRYLLCVHLTWKNSKGKARGTSIQQEIVALAEHAFERVELGGDVIPLSDPQEDRPFWHAIWSGDFDREHREYAFDVIYRAAVTPGGGAVARKPSRLGIEADDHGTQSGTLKTGVDIPLQSLVDLRETLMPEAPPLSSETLRALTATGFLARMTQTAKARLEIKGLAGKAGTIWAYPGVRAGTLIMNRAANVDALGRVLSVAEDRVAFPVPVVMHFAGYRTTGRDDTGAAPEGDEAPDYLDGKKKVFEKQATLAPVRAVGVARAAGAARRPTRRAHGRRGAVAHAS